MQKLVLASNNAKKLKELTELLAPLDITLVPQAELGVGEADEPHCTFVENALEKARHAARATGLPALADDSGICVDAFGGAPGVLSARFAGEPKSDQRNNDKLLADLAGQANRHAHYYCVLVYVRTADDPQPIIAEGEWHGEILHAPQGDGGFGYDPLFLIPNLGLSVAQVSSDEKHRRSHRGQALRRLVERLQARR